MQLYEMNILIYASDKENKTFSKYLLPSVFIFGDYFFNCFDKTIVSCFKFVNGFCLSCFQVFK